MTAVVVGDVEFGDSHPDAGVALLEFVAQFDEPVEASGAQREVAALGGEDACHPGAQPRARPGDEDPLPGHRCSVTT